MIDGFDLLVVAVPARLSANDARRVQTRLQSRRAVMIIVDNMALSRSTSRFSAEREPDPFVADVILDTKTKSWSGIDNGSGYLQHRDVSIRVSGRRVARQREHLVTRRF